MHEALPALPALPALHTLLNLLAPATPLSPNREEEGEKFPLAKKKFSVYWLKCCCLCN